MGAPWFYLRRLAASSEEVLLLVDATAKRMLNIARTRRMLVRGLKLKCPECGEGSLFNSVFKMENHCRFCGIVFEREQGYFIGAIYINIIATQLVLVLVLLVYMATVLEFDDRLLAILVTLGSVLPLLFFRHSRSLWLAFDHIFDPQKRDSGSPPRSIDD